MTALTRLLTHSRWMAGSAAGLCLLVSGCGSSADAVPTLPDAGAPSAQSAGAGATLSAFRAAIACARSHGMAGLPDPVLDARGNVILPGIPNPPKPTPAVQAACGELIDRAAALRNASSAPPPSSADLRSLTRFARCIRAHGDPQWPDPDPNHPGQFTFPSRTDLPPAMVPPSPDVKHFFAPCRQFMPAIGISIGFAGGS